MQEAITVAIPMANIIEAREMYAEYTAATINIEEIDTNNSVLHDALWRLFPDGIPDGFMVEVKPDGSYSIHVDMVRRLLDTLGLSCVIINRETVVADDLTAEAMRRG